MSTEPVTIDRLDLYREAISHFATGVTVITTRTPKGAAGMTANAVSSVSLEPTLLLVCVSKRLPTHEALERSRRFAVNVLGEGQEELARRFATPLPDKFAGVELLEGSDVPVLKEAIAHFVCAVHERFPGGDHSIFTGEVLECSCVPRARPLLFFQSAFTTLGGAKPDPLDELSLLWVAGGM